MDTNKSCATCPSFLKGGSDAVSKFKKSVNSPICGRFGIPLSKPGATPAQAKKVQIYFANKCDAYGQPLPPIPVEERLTVALPDPEVLDTSTITAQQQDLCTSCAMCSNFVRDDVVAGELGWTAGLCRARGKLILPNRQTQEAKGCEYRRWGAISTTTVGINLLPEYEDAFSLNTDPVKAYFKSKDNFIDPSEWETERKVSTEEAASGIRAWRSIKDPSGSGREVFLPIYRTDFFGDEDREKIPVTGDPDTHPELYVDHFGGLYTVAAAWSEMDETPMLWGQAGVGKTELFRHVAWLMQMPFYRFSITARTELDQLEGKMQFDPTQGTHFQYGRLVNAWRKPCIIVIDEPNTGPPEVWQFLRPLTDNSKQLVLDSNNGETIARHPDCYLGMAANPAWDPKNVGAMEIGDADANRLLHISVPMPPEVLEREIIANRVKVDGWDLEKDQLDLLMRCAADIRGLVDEGTLPITWGIRPQLKVARSLKWFDPVTAYRRAIGDFLEPEAQETLLAVIRSHVL